MGLHPPSLTRRIHDAGEDYRDRQSRCFRHQRRTVAGDRNYHIDLPGDEIGSQRWQPIKVALRPAVFNRYVLSLYITSFVQSFVERANSSPAGNLPDSPIRFPRGRWPTWG